MKKKHLAEIDICDKLSSNDFYNLYLSKQKPVLIKGMISKWSAIKNWSPNYFSKKIPDKNIVVKNYTDNREIIAETLKMEQYVYLLDDYIIKKETDPELKLPPYCHDIPLFLIAEFLTQDILPFPVDYLPSWYQEKWWRYLQFFMGPSNSLTPLHFDCLLTNNLFFQIYGEKRFTLLDPSEGKHCGRRGWRWYDLDPENPNLKKYPDYQQCHPITVTVSPGDILFMPSRMLHHVRSLSTSISFNIDFHTAKTSINSLVAGLKGMPKTNLYYNFLSVLGLVFKIPPNIIFPYYRSYLNYIS